MGENPFQKHTSERHTWKCHFIWISYLIHFIEFGSVINPNQWNHFHFISPHFVFFPHFRCDFGLPCHWLIGWTHNPKLCYTHRWGKQQQPEAEYEPSKFYISRQHSVSLRNRSAHWAKEKVSGQTASTRIQIHFNQSKNLARFTSNPIAIDTRGNQMTHWRMEIENKCTFSQFDLVLLHLIADSNRFKLIYLI